MIAELACIFDPIVTSYSRGDGKWFVQFYDRATAAFYAGTGATAFEALAWAMDEYLTRGILKFHRVARGPEERPGDLYREAKRIAAGMAEAFKEKWDSPATAPVVMEATIKVTGDITHAAYIASTELTDSSADKVEAIARSVAGGCFALQIDDAKKANEPPPKRRKKAKGP